MHAQHTYQNPFLVLLHAYTFKVLGYKEGYQKRNMRRTPTILIPADPIVDGIAVTAMVALQRVAAVSRHRIPRREILGHHVRFATPISYHQHSW